MELILSRGLDNILFGLRQADVLSILGEPDKEFISEEDQEEIIVQYNTRKLRLSFYQNEEGKLAYLDSANSDLMYKGKKIIGQSISAVQQEVFPEITDWEVEHYDTFDTYYNDEFSLTLFVDYGQVTQVEWGVPINFEDEYVWPE